MPITPGTWVVDDNAPDPIRVIVKRFANDEKPGIRVVATMRYSDYEGAADAKLIAAAPDLLEALEAIIDDMGDDGLCACEQNKRKALDAYEKATGRRVPT